MNIQPSTLQFLRDIRVNNDRDWFQANKAHYDRAWKNMQAFVKALEAEMNKTDLIESAKPFRIYRDVRFSKDKSPYKTNLGAGFQRATAQLRGGYYLHIEPGGCFAGGGFWDPNSQDLKRIREEFALDDQPIRKIMAAPEFINYFGTLRGDELKTAPQGYTQDHPAIDLLRKKQLLISRPFTDAEVLQDNFLNEVAITFQAMRPFFDYMSEVLTTDLNGESIL
ncbi:MAG: DUF2461 domain-containing protein [Lewinellaceae bacterium]|nr:DUF2461 domain-containing protein [Lewinellaceae bacterium]